ncbi:hypothetical protein glysoja_041438 [Glycine soja]|uniref:Uncharacterized protein n=1 Tax=Glycine soja TaxID=3848 RepID=A0A0B2Q8S9_GLYSO|nr:hypothetical protein glysoja_041438 [Glycine soja]
MLNTHTHTRCSFSFDFKNPDLLTPLNNFPRYSSSSSVKKHHDPICTICDSGSRFNSGIEFASFVTSSHVLLHRSWIVTSSYHEDTCSKKKEGEGLSWKVHKRPDSDLTIIAFEATLDYSDFQADLVPSYAPTEEKILHFDLLCDEINPIFSVNNTTISLFHKNHCRLDQLKSMDFITLHQSNSVLEGSISLQLRALALTPHMQRNVLSNPFKKLNQMEEGPEWYKILHWNRACFFSDKLCSSSSLTMGCYHVPLCRHHYNQGRGNIMESFQRTGFGFDDFSV